MSRRLCYGLALCLVLSGCAARTVVQTEVELCPPEPPEVRCVDPGRPTTLKKLEAAIRKCVAVDTAWREAWGGCREEQR